MGASSVLTISDTLYVVDYSNARMTVLDPKLKLARSMPVPPQTSGMVWLADSQALILNALVPDRSRIGLPFHRFDRSGNMRGSFGPVHPAVLPGDFGRDLRFRLAAYGRDLFLAARTVDGWDELQVWSVTTGTLVASYRIASEAPELARAQDGTPRPTPTTSAVATDSLGRVWVLLAIPNQGWRKGIVAEKVGDPGVSGQGWRVIDQDFGVVYDTLIRVIDLGERRVVAQQVVDPSCRFFTPTLQLVCDDHYDDGSYGLSIRAVALSAPR